MNNPSVPFLTYDPFGRRIFKDVSGTRTYFAYSEEGMVAELDDSGSVTRSYGYSPNGLWGTGALFMRSASGYAYYQHDHLATPQQMIDSTGAKVWEGRQKAFGEVQEVVGAGENALRFPGQYYDMETGFHYNYFRYYDPVTGRYLTSDRIGIADGLNVYSYSGNNSLTGFDSLGLYTQVEDIRTWCIKKPVACKELHDALGRPMPINIDDTSGTGDIPIDTSLSDEAKDALDIDADEACPQNGDKDPCKGLRNQLKKHQQKLRQYSRDPLSMDNDGRLAAALKSNNIDRAQRIFDGRVKSLTGQIKNFRLQLILCEIKNGLR